MRMRQLRGSGRAAFPERQLAISLFSRTLHSAPEPGQAPPTGGFTGKELWQVRAVFSPAVFRAVTPARALTSPERPLSDPRVLLSLRVAPGHLQDRKMMTETGQGACLELMA